MGRKQYNQLQMDEAVDLFLSGKRMREISQQFPAIPERTIREKAVKRERGVPDARPGPKPVLGPEAEAELVEWILQKKNEDIPVTRTMILEKANEKFRGLYGEPGTLKVGWLTNFKTRHPSLSPSGNGKRARASSGDNVNGSTASSDDDGREDGTSRMDGMETRAKQKESQTKSKRKRAPAPERRSAKQQRVNNDTASGSRKTSSETSGDDGKAQPPVLFPAMWSGMVPSMMMMNHHWTKQIEEHDKMLRTIMQTTEKLMEIQAEQQQMLQQILAQVQNPQQPTQPRGEREERAESEPPGVDEK